RTRVVARGVGIHLRFESSAAASRNRSAGARQCVGGQFNALRVDDVEDDTLLRQPLRGPAYFRLEAFRAAVYSHPETAGDRGHRETSSDPDQILASWNAC